VPTFWVGLYLILIFAVWLGWLPSSGYPSIFDAGGLANLRYLLLPSLTLAAPNAALILRLTRASMLDVGREDYVRTARAKGIRLETHCEQALPRVRCAPDKVERILYNLLTNALRHTPGDGAVAVLVSVDQHGVVVAVEDTGAGLTKEAERRMFERFWRADPARATDGSGLGLAIAQGLVEAQGGRIWAENRHEGGARVAFTLQPARGRRLAHAAAD
jgi:signal transduction histidine kinase